MKLFDKTDTSISLNQETCNLLMSDKHYKALDRIRYLIANLYNNNTFPDVELFSLLRNADEDHAELAMDIIEINQLENGEACFLMINHLAPDIISKFLEEET